MTNRFRKVKAYHETDEPGVNLTPLIDVVFSILIMFIVIAPLLELDEIALANGGSASSHRDIAFKEAGPLSIYVHQDNSIWLNKQQVELSKLTALLKLEKQKNPLVRPQLFHDKRAQFGTYQSVKNAVESAGFDQLDVILKP